MSAICRRRRPRIPFWLHTERQDSEASSLLCRFQNRPRVLCKLSIRNAVGKRSCFTRSLTHFSNWDKSRNGRERRGWVELNSGGESTRYFINSSGSNTKMCLSRMNETFCSLIGRKNGEEKSFFPHNVWKKEKKTTAKAWNIKTKS